MDILNFTSRKRSTYQIQFEYSLLWECALGIAAITNTPIINTLEKPLEYWNTIKENLSTALLKELDYVEKNNTWKTLLQLLHKKKFNDLTEFSTYIHELPESDLKFISLPFIGHEFQELRNNAALGNVSAITEMKNKTKDNPFFPQYIDYICTVNLSYLREHLINVMGGWYEAVIKKDSEELSIMLRTDFEMKKNMLEKLDPEALVEWATGGVSYKPEPSVSKVLLIPQYIYRPWNIEADIEDTKVFYYPISNESISPEDRYMPNNFLVLKYKALGDEARMKIVKLLFEQERTLQEITDRVKLGKSTVHHHLKILRSAKLVEIVDSKYSLKKLTIRFLAEELNLYLKK
ncbi:ArsR/SmtB family transcription factor [Paucisalibacillus globulus]|uniref:ArsR/SmtB family transcription factor n=1 Tax=Paucisalibacillus globulus TaxID=351095 RepID=UPI00041D13D1|nr:metalloregulator ArsR/SmtB family transcription factor [Paucisalibacillus globulus]